MLRLAWLSLHATSVESPDDDVPDDGASSALGVAVSGAGSGPSAAGTMGGVDVDASTVTRRSAIDDEERVLGNTRTT